MQQESWLCEFVTEVPAFNPAVASGLNGRYSNQVSGWVSGDSNSGISRRFFLSPKRPHGSGAHSASHEIGTGVLSAEGKFSWREADYSPLSTDELQNEWRYTVTSSIPFMASTRVT